MRGRQVWNSFFQMDGVVYSIKISAKRHVGYTVLLSLCPFWKAHSRLLNILWIGAAFSKVRVAKIKNRQAKYKLSSAENCESIQIWALLRHPDPYVFLGLPVPDPLVTSIDLAPDPSIIMQKKWEKPWFLLFCDFFMTFSSWKMMSMYQCFGLLPDLQRICKSEVWIRCSGSVPKYGYTTLDFSAKCLGAFDLNSRAKLTYV